MLVTLLGIVIEVKPVQPQKARFPMLVTLSGINTDSIDNPLKHSSPIVKHLSPIALTVSGITTLGNL